MVKKFQGCTFSLEKDRYSSEKRFFRLTEPVAVFSPTEYFVSIASAPIIAAGWGSQKVNTWMNTDVRGYAPMRANDSLKTPITVLSRL